MPNPDLLYHLTTKHDYISLQVAEQVSVIQELVKELGISVIIDEIIEVLQSKKEEEVFVVSLFLRGVCTKKSQRKDFDEVVAQFRSAIDKSDIFQIMNKNLYSTDRLIRETTYRTFGLTCFTHNAHFLKEASPYYKEHFPDQLEALESEYKWLINVAKDEAKR